MRLRVVHRSQLGPNHRTCGYWASSPDEQRRLAELYIADGRSSGLWYRLRLQDEHKQWFIIDTLGRDGR